MNPITFAVIVTSDSASRGEKADRSGAVLKELILGEKSKFKGILHQLRIVPDDLPTIRHALEGLLTSNAIDVILTTGGTGFGPRDVTTEATNPLITKDAPGLTHALYARSFVATPMAALSRLQAGIAGETLIVNLPGSPKAVKECFDVLEPVLPHLVALLKNRETDVKSTHDEMLSRPNSCVCEAQLVVKHLKATAENSGTSPGGTGPPPNASTLTGPPEGVGKTALMEPDATGQKPGTTGFSVIDRPRRSTYPMVEVPDALKSIIDALDRHFISTSTLVDTLDCSGYTLAEDIRAPEAHPPFRASIKDGYAVIASEGPGRREVVGTAPAGSAQGPRSSVHPGTCVRVSTGAPVPEGADAVVQVEDTTLIEVNESGSDEKSIKINTTPKPGQDIRPIGSDIGLGSILLTAGTILNPSDVGLLCSVGIRQVLVHEKPRIGLMSTGDEILPWTTPAPLPYGQIRDSNRPMLQALFKGQGFVTLDLGAPKDCAEEIRKFLLDSFEKVDVIISTGGVSMGEKDLLKHVLTTALNFGVIFGRIHMKPGKPTTFAHGKVENAPNSRNHKFFFGLPGNPVSAFVVSHLLVLPTVRYMSAKRPLTSCQPAKLSVTLSHAVKLDPRPEYQRAHFVYDDHRHHYDDAHRTPTKSSPAPRAHAVIPPHSHQSIIPHAQHTTPTSSHPPPPHMTSSSMAPPFVASTSSNQLSSRLASNTSGTLLLCLPSSNACGAKVLERGKVVEALLIGD